MPQPRDVLLTRPDFARWFCGSQIVDEQGLPLEVFHGTDQDFHTFDTGNRGTIHFTVDRVMASRYATERIPDYEDDEDYVRGEFQHVIPVYLHAANPYRPELEGHRSLLGGLRDLTGDWEALEHYADKISAAGFDAILVDGFWDIAVFKAHQIKSSLGCQWFSSTHPSIVGSDLSYDDLFKLHFGGLERTGVRRSSSHAFGVDGPAKSAPMEREEARSSLARLSAIAYGLECRGLLEEVADTRSSIRQPVKHP